MKSLRRYDKKNTDFFITVVSCKRGKILLNNIPLFWKSWDRVIPEAWVILPDHFHVLIKTNNLGISDIMHRFKIKYSRLFRNLNGPGPVWQNRFWDHLIRNQDDMNKHLDYIHYNPVKHGLVRNPFEYPHTSLEKYQNYYPPGWGVNDELNMDGDFGE